MTEATVLDGRHAYRPQAIGRVFGWFFLATFVTSILAYFVGYAKMLDDPGLITGTGADPSTGIASGATLEVFLIIANVATAVVAYPVLKRQSEMGAIGYVSARLVEAMFIAIGIVGALAFLLMRQDATATSTPVLGQAFVALYRRAFLVGPGFFAGLANGVILGYLMYRSELVPRGMTWLGLIGGPLVMITGILVMFNAIPRGGAVQGIATIPEFLWELSLSIYCIVKGFRLSSPILRMETVMRLPETESALRHEA
ncbi:MAG: DUF4386 domain-containing protein [Chloroflexota bacterium]|nr:DUF4386 domain-containing protein [Chloroflexota bacterium]